VTGESAADEPVAHREALRQRLVEAAGVLGIESNRADESTSHLIHRLAVHARTTADPAVAWLFAIALTGCFPTAEELSVLRRRLDLASDGGAMAAALGATLSLASRAGRLDRKLRIVADSIVVDVNFCATHEHNTGIQRVVRQTIPRWVAEGRDLVLVAWTAEAEGMRGLDPAELDRVLYWGDRKHPERDAESVDDAIIVPWRSDVFLPEVPLNALCAPLAALAESSGNRLTAIGYDAIPLVSAQGQRAEESQRFANYLTLLKHADAVLAISGSAAGEFQGFVDALPAQGLIGPLVASVPLAVDAPGSIGVGRGSGSTRAASPPLVLCVGSHEPRKNQDAVLHAAHTLLRQGQEFRMLFIGGGDRSNRLRFDRRVAKLHSAGFDITSRRAVTDAELWELYREARFSVFVSLHEGYGLPVAESLALGTPVLTSDYGSLAEIADGGGCVTVNPRSDDQIIAGMRKLLTDDALLAKLVAQAARRPPRGWDDYARELWSAAGLDRARS
jgi:glycosyltransferase involved in cell wall biosynthesis